MLNIVTALNIEAKPIIKRFNLKPVGEIYQNNYINLIVTGSGKIKSAINTALLLNKFKYKTLNIGISGSNTHQINEGFFISKIIDTDTGFDYYPDFFQNSFETLHTVSVTGKYFPLVDMEGSGFFEACYKFLTVEKIILYKIVSDTPEMKINENTIPHLIENHISVIEELLDDSQNDEFKEITLLVEEYSKKIHLTQTQKQELKNLLTYMKIKNKPLPTNIPLLKNKKEVRKFLTSLSDSLRI